MGPHAHSCMTAACGALLGGSCREASQAAAGGVIAHQRLLAGGDTLAEVHSADGERGRGSDVDAVGLQQVGGGKAAGGCGAPASNTKSHRLHSLSSQPP